MFQGNDTVLQPIDSHVVENATTNSPIPIDGKVTVGKWVMARHKGFREGVRGKVPIYT